jgi:CIC family chloride channel protein
MLNSFVFGFTIGLFLLLPALLTRGLSKLLQFPTLATYPWGGTLLSGPIWILLGGFFATLLSSRWISDSREFPDREYEGLSDALEAIHRPTEQPSFSTRWIRAARNFALFLLGGSLGPEGYLIEAGFAALALRRNRLALWFEQQRRTDAASVFAAALAASFLAPIAGVIWVMELAVGGRTLSVIFSVLGAYLCASWLRAPLQLDFPVWGALIRDFRLDRPSEWVLVIFIGLLSGILSAGILKFWSWLRRGFASQFSREKWYFRAILGVFMMAAVAWLFPEARLPGVTLLEQAISGQLSAAFLGLAALSILLLALWANASWGGAGVFWPITVSAGLLGCSSVLLLQKVSIPIESEAVALAGLIAISGVFSSVFGTPLAAALLVFEWTRSEQILVPALITAFLAHWVRSQLVTESWVFIQLGERGLKLSQGRSVEVMKQVRVTDAMTLSVPTALETDSLASLRARQSEFKYPFIPVINSKGNYAGMITLDQLLEQEGPESSVSPGQGTSQLKALAELVEARDLVLRGGWRPPTVQEQESLWGASRLLGDSPCLPVVSSSQQVTGLLFASHLRLAYEQAMNRSSASISASKRKVLHL